MTIIHSLDEFNAALLHEPAVLFYFSTAACGVCKVLKPKVDEYFRVHYPRVKLYYADMEEAPEIAAQQGIFVAPTVMICFGGKEFARLSRVFGINELDERVGRPYRMMFEN